MNGEAMAPSPPFPEALIEGYDRDQLYEIINKLIELGAKAPKGIELFDTEELRKTALELNRDPVAVKNFYKPDSCFSMSEEEFKNYNGIEENPRFICNLPENNFITQYMNYSSSRTDAYIDYAHAGAVALLSCICDRRAYISLTTGVIYTNLWCFIIGRSTISRKSTSFQFMKEFLNLVMPAIPLHAPGSPAAFIEDLEGIDRTEPDQNGHGLLAVDEAVSLLQLMKQNNMREFRELFMRLYDCSYFSKMLRSSPQRKTHTKFVIAEPYLNIFFATTPDNFADTIQKIDISSGFLIRFLPYHPNHNHELRDISHMSEDMRAKHNEIALKLKEIRDIIRDKKIDFYLSQDSLKYYNEWKTQGICGLQNSDEDDAGAFDRLSINALKLAVLYTIGDPDFKNRLESTTQTAFEGNLIIHEEYSHKAEIKHDYLIESCRQVDKYFNPMMKILCDLSRAGEKQNYADIILRTIDRAKGKLDRKNLMKRTHLTRKNLDEGLETLFESGELSVVNVKGQICYIRGDG